MKTACKLNPPCRLKRLDPSRWPKLEVDGPALGRKAACIPGLGRVWVEKKFIDSLDTPHKKLALVLHEVGHLEGADCEDCADRRAGQIYRELGFPDEREGVALFGHTLQHRDGSVAARHFSEGFRGVPGEAAADSSACGGSVDEAGLCKVSATPGRRLVTRGADEEVCGCLNAHRPALSWRTPRQTYVAFGADASTVAAALSAPSSGSEGDDYRYKLLTQTFPTSVSPADSLAQIIADAAVDLFPDDPLRYAWILAAMINHEAAPISWKTPWIKNAKSLNVPADASSHAVGLSQILVEAHPEMATRLMPDGSKAIKDPRVNVHMGAEVLQQARKDLPGDVAKQMLAYAIGATGARDPDYLAKYPGRAAEFNANQDELSTLSDWDVPDVTNDALWGANTQSTTTPDLSEAKQPAASLQGMMDTASSALGIGTSSTPEAQSSAVHNAILIGLFLLIIYLFAKWQQNEKEA